LVSANPSAEAMEAFKAHFERHVATSARSSAGKGNKTPQRCYYGKPDLLETLEKGDVDAMEVGLHSLPGRGVSDWLRGPYWLYMDHTARHQLVIWIIRRTRPCHSHSRGLSAWLHGPYRRSSLITCPSSTGDLDHTPY
jgi:hypothetical protein